MSNQNPTGKISPILQNPAKIFYRGILIGLIIGFLAGLFVAFLNVSGTKPPNFSSETLSAMKESRSLFIILAFTGGFGIIGLLLTLLSWLAAKFQSK